MSRLPLADWLASLDVMEAMLAATIATSDKHQRDRIEVPIDAEPCFRPGLDGLARLEWRLAEWDARLAAAEELSTSVERQITDGEAAVRRWRGLFAEWQELIQHRAEAQAVS
jgi:hypothetical protein